MKLINRNMRRRRLFIVDLRDNKKLTWSEIASILNRSKERGRQLYFQGKRLLAQEFYYEQCRLNVKMRILK